MQQVCFVNSDQPPIDVDHVCFYTWSDGNKISTYEVVVEHFPHPDTELATVQLTNIYLRSQNLRTETRAAQAILLEAAQNNMNPANFTVR